MEAVFILVEPAAPGNIGAAARAIKVMGFRQLWLVSPAPYLEGEAKWLAHGSHDILTEARTFSTLKEASDEVDLLIATSAKSRRVKKDYDTIETLPGKLSDVNESVSRFGVVFGREESGLTNTEMNLCDWISYTPMQTTYPSLNLAQAVMLYAYVLSRDVQLLGDAIKPPPVTSFRKMKQNIRETLINAGFRNDDPILSRILERISLLGDKDLRLVFSVLHKINKRLKPQ